MSESNGACGRRCSALARAEAKGCELEAFVLEEIEHVAAHFDQGGEIEDAPREPPASNVIGGGR